MLKRLLFSGIVNDTRFKFLDSNHSMFSVDGMPRSVDTSYEGLTRNYKLTGNKGNMLIGESVQRIFEFDRNRSVYTSIIQMYKHINNQNKFSKILKENFDGIVLPMANFIRPPIDRLQMAKIIEAIEDVDIFVFGAGIQNPININQLKSGNIRFLKTLNEKAKIFGVRGDKTREFLVSNEIDNAIALGCLSIYLYPENIINLREVNVSKIKRIVAAGHIASPQRLARLSKPFCKDNLDVDYIIQSEILDLDFLADKYFYNDATGECDSEIIKEALRKKFGTKVTDIPFKKFYCFNNVDAWRHCCHTYDLYIGDRLHGAIAALQSGIPAIIVYDNLRVQELAEFWGIPSLPLQDFSESRVEVIISKYLSSDSLNRFKKQYLSKLTKFANCVESNGLVLANKNIQYLIESQEKTQTIMDNQKITIGA